MILRETSSAHTVHVLILKMFVLFVDVYRLSCSTTQSATRTVTFRLRQIAFNDLSLDSHNAVYVAHPIRLRVGGTRVIIAVRSASLSIAARPPCGISILLIRTVMCWAIFSGVGKCQRVGAEIVWSEIGFTVFQTSTARCDTRIRRECSTESPFESHPLRPDVKRRAGRKTVHSYAWSVKTGH